MGIFFSRLILFCIFLSNVTFGQEKSRVNRQNRFWADAGLAIVKNNNLATNTSLNYQRNNLIFTGQYLQNDEMLSGSFPVEESKEVALMSGLANRYKYFTVVLQAGPHLQSGIKRGKFINRTVGEYGYDYYESDPYKNKLGLTTQIQGFINMKYVGLGGKIFSSINQKSTFWGFGVNIFLGKLR